MQTAQDNQWFSSETLHRLLGSEGGELVSRGNLTVGSARLGEGERYFLSENKEAKKHLYRILYSTAIEHDTGVAKTTSLRSMEVAVPMTLHATLEIQNGTAEDIDAIKHAASLITHIGAKRHRGLGQSFVKVKEEALA
ncbi:RAMP superfamily CRISPR-associated protein [Vibrio breoganii]|uniref:RAMP superfamily CRISPR-associated protein n=1 Tax=Vibrio breoganii TaxID=553239 RepID=UPI0039A741FC